MKIPAGGRGLDVRRSALYAVIVNAVQIIAVWTLAVMLYLEHRHSQAVITFIISGLVTVGAIIDIREALAARRKSEEADALGDMVNQMDDLNRALRAQRHDFLNHLQVVYSLIEMEEYEEAGDYIEKVYGDMQSVSRALRTDSPALNALLRAKLAECENAGVLAEVDALESVSDRQLRIMLHSDAHGYAFSIANNGPAIPADNLERIFEPGVSSHGEGRGMGLYIVRRTLERYGGDIHVTSDENRTVFSGLLPQGKELRNGNEEAQSA